MGKFFATEIADVASLILAIWITHLIHFQFETWHVLTVCAVLILLHSLEPFCRCLRSCVVSCENITCIENCASFLRQIVLMLSFAQPFILCVILLYHSSTNNREYSNTVFVSTIQLYCMLSTLSTQTHNHSDDLSRHYISSNETSLLTAQCEDIKISERASLIEVDVLFFVMPFAICTSLSTVIWVHLGHENILHESLTWDESIDVRCMWYELAYACELFFCLMAFVGLVADGTAWYTFYYAVMASGLLLVLIANMARMQRPPEAEFFIMFVVLTACILILPNIWFHVINIVCTFSLVLSILLAVYVILVILMHLSAKGEWLCSTVIAFRSMSSLCVGYLFIGVYLAGKNKLCF